jgi:hypothetical protein
LVYSCDCGNNKCWDGDEEKCVTLKQFKVTYAQIKEDEKKEIEDAAEEEKKKSSLGKLVAAATQALAVAAKSGEKSDAVTSSDPNVDYLGFLKQVCKSQGGNWKDFGNSCAGTCESKAADQKNLICSAVISSSCDCGDNKCWHQNKCMEISKFKEMKSMAEALKNNAANTTNTSPNNSNNPENINDGTVNFGDSNNISGDPTKNITNNIPASSGAEINKAK